MTVATRPVVHVVVARPAQRTKLIKDRRDLTSLIGEVKVGWRRVGGDRIVIDGRDESSRRGDGCGARVLGVVEAKWHARVHGEVDTRTNGLLLQPHHVVDALDGDQVPRIAKTCACSSDGLLSLSDLLY